jgi:oligopeptidase B
MMQGNYRHQKTPIAKQRPHPITQHGLTRVDEYYWLRDHEDPEVKRYLLAENDYLEKVLGHTQALQQKLFVEMKNRIKEADSSVPERRGEYYYYTRTEENRQYPIYCRKHLSLESEEQILIDQNLLADGHEFCSLGAFTVSPDGTKLAYSLDLEGAETYTLYVKDLTTAKLLPYIIPGISGSYYFHMGVEWSADSRSLFYITLDDPHRACKLHLHHLGQDPKSDRLVFFEEDPTYSLGLFKTRNKRFIMTYHYNTTSQEMRFIPADRPQSTPVTLLPRRKGLEYSATHHSDSFYVLTNEEARNFRLMKAAVHDHEIRNWQELVPHREGVLIESIEVFERHLVLQERWSGQKRIRISDLDGTSNVHYVEFPETVYDVSPEGNSQFHTNRLRFRYSSMITPFTIVDYHMDTGTWETRKQDELPNGYDPQRYITERILAPAVDGKTIPISLVYRKDLKKNGKNPTLLHGYGAYGASSEASFNPNILSLLDRGFVYAIGHVRGGSELGYDWYEQGRLLNKRNSFTDFIACAEELIRQGFTSSEKLAISGSSAGGLLVGACMTMRPDLFRAVVCKVPFLDAVTSMSDPSIPLVTLEYDQWGDPADKEVFDYMLSYSPYDNIKAFRYPHILLTTGFNDPRVAYWEPAKFAARLRRLKLGDSLVLLQTDFNAGHGGATGRYDYLKEYVLEYAFLIDVLG